MILIQNILTDHSIEFDEKFIIGHDDNFITLELPKGFDWLDHTRECDDCGKFLKDIEDGSASWLLSIDNERWLIDPATEFGDKKSYPLSHLSTTVTNGVSQSWLKLRIRPIDKDFIEHRQTDELQKENYERCAVLRDVLKKIGE